MGKSSPKAPDPVATAQAQGAMNRDTAITQQQLNMVDQVNPWGNVSYTQNGVNRYQDSSGKWVETPKYTQTTTFSPEQQAIFDASQGAQTNLANLAQQQSGMLQDHLGKPFQFDNQAAADWAYDLGASRLDPRFEQQQAALETQLANQGIARGSRAWETAMNQQAQSKNDAYNQLMLNGRSQAFNEALTTYNAPVNTITALLSGSQVSNPATQSGATPQTGVAGVDYTGLVNQNYQSQLNNRGAALGGLFGLGGSLLGAAGNAGGFGALFSDRRLKKNISHVGMTNEGLNLYKYQYIDGGPFHIGVMAQEAAEEQPDVVRRHDSGYLMVDYSEVR